MKYANVQRKSENSYAVFRSLINPRGGPPISLCPHVACEQLIGEAAKKQVFTARLEAQRCQVTPYVVNFLLGVTDSFI